MPVLPSRANEDGKTGSLMIPLNAVLSEARPGETRVGIPAVLEEVAKPVPPPPPTVKRGGRRSASSPQILTWKLDKLSRSADPLAKGLLHLFGNGAKAGLFLAITAPPAGALLPHFVATAAIGGEGKLAVWTGLRWDPAVIPEMWNKFVQSGFFEVPPPGSMSAPTSQRNVIRAALDVSETEWLLLVRVGPPNACRGVLALISTQSIVSALAPALALVSQPVSSRSAA
jgi:hypothetical protein